MQPEPLRLRLYGIQTVFPICSPRPGAGAVATTGGTMAEIYKSKWLREKEAKMAAELEDEYASKRLK